MAPALARAHVRGVPQHVPGASVGATSEPSPVWIPVWTGRGYVQTVVDESDASRVAPYDWRLSRNGYAERKERGRNVSLHRDLMGCRVGDGIYVDHINRDRLDNRRANLRIVTPAESRQNTPAIGGTSHYRGVIRYRGRWIAQAQLDGKCNWIGSFDSEEAAAEAASRWRAEHMPFSGDATSLPGHAVRRPSLPADSLSRDDGP